MSLLKQSRENNKKHDITGLLLFKDHTFLQLIEGNNKKVLSLFQRIIEDMRHHHIRRLLFNPIEQRSFSDWSMGFKHLDTVLPAPAIGASDFLNTDYETRPTHEMVDDAMRLLHYFSKSLE